MVGAIVYTAWHLLPNFVVVLAFAYLIFSHQQTDGLSRSLQVLGVPFTSLMIAVFFLLLSFSRSFGQLSSGRVLAKQLGKITYSMYMIHFPIQFLMVLFSENVFTLDFLSPMVFLAFFAFTIGLAFLCYDRFEIRVQGFLRNRFQKTGSKPSPIAV
jgi:peptidoglycan/LPS O-acetylase OafA/YrhL